MHKGIILLVEAKNKEHARSEAEKFLEPYGDGDVWDWYAVGGRWSGTLNKNHNKFNKMVQKKYPLKKGDYGRSYQWIEEHLDEFKKMWESLGETSKNPYARDMFISKDYDRTFDDDIMPLKDSLSIVKEWTQDPVKEGKKELVRAKKWLNGESAKDDWDMYGYVVKRAGEMFSQSFSFDTNVYNTVDGDFSIPTDVYKYFAVMIDIHN